MFWANVTDISWGGLYSRLLYSNDHQQVQEKEKLLLPIIMISLYQLPLDDIVLDFATPGSAMVASIYKTWALIDLRIDYRYIKNFNRF